MGTTQPVKHEPRIWRMQEKCCDGTRSKDLKIPKQLIYPKEKSVLAAGQAETWVGVESASSVKETEAKQHTQGTS